MLLSNLTVIYQYSGKVSRELYDGIVEGMLGNQQLLHIGVPTKSRNTQQSGGAFYVLWQPMDKWIQEINQWALENGTTANTIYTVYELLEGEHTEGRTFHQMDAELLVTILERMEDQKIVQLLHTSDDIKTIGVKFIKV